MLIIGGVLAGGAAWGAVEFARSVEADYAATAAGSPPSPSATPIGERLNGNEEAALGQVVASLKNPGIRVHKAVWEDREMRTARLPVVVTNTDTTPRRIRAQLLVFASPDGHEVNLYDGIIDSGEEIAPGKSLVEDVTVDSVRAIGQNDLRVELRPIADRT
ncbi:hypothetical protein StrepF001_27045 [Streptomyces sp. F001]|nr:hypothetical protein StrepF001_27045 [Streptomyces sp. F001]